MTDQEKDEQYTPLRVVTLESVAAYLRCEPQRLATALRRPQCRSVRRGRERLHYARCGDVQTGPRCGGGDPGGTHAETRYAGPAGQAMTSMNQI